MKQPEFLIVMEEGIGNMVMLTPALQSLKRLLRAKLTVCGRHPSLEVVRGLCETLDVSRASEGLRGRKFDTGFFTLWSQKTLTMYKDVIIPCCRRVYQNSMKKIRHESEVYMDFPRYLGYTGETPSPYVDIVPRKYPGKYVVLSDTTLDHPEWQRKRWPYFYQLAERFLETGTEVVAVGGPAEAKKNRWPRWVNVQEGKQPLNVTAAIIRDATMFIGNDSGPAHIAGAVGTKTYVFFGPTIPEKNVPLGPDVHVLSEELPCSPCQYTDRWPECKRHICMEYMTVDDVWEVVTA